LPFIAALYPLTDELESFYQIFRVITSFYKKNCPLLSLKTLLPNTNAPAWGMILTQTSKGVLKQRGRCKIPVQQQWWFIKTD